MIRALLDEESHEGGWYAAVIRARAQLLTDDCPGVVHVAPVFGRPHTPSTDCWCDPEQDHIEPRIYIHSASN